MLSAISKSAIVASALFTCLVTQAQQPLRELRPVGEPEPLAFNQSSGQSSNQSLSRPEKLTATPPIKNAPHEFDQRMTALELALSTIVSERPGLWRFEPLENEATELLLIARDDNDRQAVRSVAERIEHFASLAERYRQQRSAPMTQPEPAPIASTSVGTRSRVAPQVTRTKARVSNNELRPSGYDAVGVLRPVVSKRADAPKYALVGDDGRLLTFVSPTQPVSGQFDKLLGKRIGVRGVRGFRTDLKRDHLTAERVTPLGTRYR